MGAASSIIETGTDIISDAKDLVEDGAGVVSDVVEDVATAVDNAVSSALNDPVATAAKVAAVASGHPELIPYIDAANTVSKGGSVEDMLTNAAISQVASQVGGNVGAETGSGLAGGAAAGATSAGLRGGDISQGAITGGLSSGIRDLSKEISDQSFEDWSQQQGARAYDNSVGPTEQDVLAADPTIPLTSPLSTPTSATGPGYYNEETGEYIESDIGGLRAPLDNTSGTMVMDGYSYDPQTRTWTTPSGETYDMGYLQSLGAPISGSDILPPSSDTSEGYDPAFTTKEIQQGLNFLKNALFDGSPSQMQRRQRALGYAFSPEEAGIPWLDTRTQMLKGVDTLSDVVPTSPLGGLGSSASAAKGAVPQFTTPSVTPQIAGITPELMSVIADRGINMMASGGGVQNFACGSSASSYCSTWGPMGQYAPKFFSVKCNMLAPAGGKRNPVNLAQLKQLQSHIAAGGNMGGMAKGGLPSKYEEAAPDGHKPEFITGLTGYYAGGRGTGQSDDIPAMLHDGDYVIDAEAVSAFGDGSSKAGNEVLMKFMHQVPHRKSVGEGKPVPAKIADGEVVLPESFVTALGGGDNKRGAQMLDEMRERLREHKRSAPNSKIPPKAKSPLDYLKGVKG